MKGRSDEIVGKSVYEYLKCQDPHTTPIPQHFEALRGVSSQFEYKRNHRVLELHLEPLRSKSGDITDASGPEWTSPTKENGREGALPGYT